MALDLLALLRAVAGQGQGQPQVQPQAQPMAPGAMQQLLQPQAQPPAILPDGLQTPAPPPAPDIQIGNNHLPPPTLRQGIIHGGTFGLGHTGGNILGAIGDAFLTQGGAAQQYAPKLQQAREAEGLKSFDSDPSGSLSNLLGVNAPLALNQFNVLHDNNRQQASADSVIADQTLARQLKGRNIAAGMIYAANGSTWPAMKAQIKRIAQANGIDPDDIPEDIDAAKAWAGGSIPADEQQKNAAMAGIQQRRLEIAQQNADSNEVYRRNAAGVQTTRANNDTSRTKHIIAPPPTPTTVSGGLADKMAKTGWNSLTPQEQDTWTRMHPPKGATKAKYSVTTDANGNVHIVPAKP